MPERGVFSDILDARTKLEQWRADFNQNRPHSSLEDRTPNAFAATVVGQPFALTSVDKAVSTGCQGFADGGPKTPALDTPPKPPSESIMRAKGLSEQQLLVEAVN